MTHLAPPSVRMLVCGNADRGDDGAALSAVATLLPALPLALLERVEVRRCGQLCVEDLLDVPHGVAILIVDAATGVPPGHVVVLPLEGVAASGGGQPAPRSSHELPPDVAVRLAAELLGATPPGTFVGIGGRTFAFGRSLSRPVRSGLPALRRALAAELARLAGLPELTELVTAVRPRTRARPVPAGRPGVPT